MWSCYTVISTHCFVGTAVGTSIVVCVKVKRLIVNRAKLIS